MEHLKSLLIVLCTVMLMVSCGNAQAPKAIVPAGTPVVWTVQSEALFFDAMIRAEAPDRNFGSIAEARVGYGLYLERALMRPSLAGSPFTSRTQIDSAFLIVDAIAVSENGGCPTEPDYTVLSAFRVNQPWNEATVTWNDPWRVPGCAHYRDDIELEPTDVAYIRTIGGTYTKYALDVTEDVKHYYDWPTHVFGWILMGHEQPCSDNQCYVYMHLSEVGGTDHDPKLVIYGTVSK